MVNDWPYSTGIFRSIFSALQSRTQSWGDLAHPAAAAKQIMEQHTNIEVIFFIRDSNSAFRPICRFECPILFPNSEKLSFLRKQESIALSPVTADSCFRRNDRAKSLIIASKIKKLCLLKNLLIIIFL
jgi:hypothetical protein